MADPDPMIVCMDLARRLTVVPYPRRIPTVLSVEEVTLLPKLFHAIPTSDASYAPENNGNMHDSGGGGGGGGGM